MAWWLWVASGIVLLVIEARATREFTLLCVGSSALAVGLMTLLGIYSVPVQFVSFALLSGAAVFWVRDWLRQAASHTGLHEHEFGNVIGQIAFPLGDLVPFGFGKAELRGTTWSAHNATSVAIPSGRRCKVMAVKGLTLWIIPE
jgi:membrane protein implicated in regulation of membrane protease activity